MLKILKIFEVYVDNIIRREVFGGE